MVERPVVRKKPELCTGLDAMGCPDAAVQDTIDVGHQYNPPLGMQRSDPTSENEFEQPVVERGTPSGRTHVIDGGRRWLKDCVVVLDRTGITKERHDRSGHRQTL